MKVLIAKYTTLAGLSLTVLHYTSHGVLQVEDAVSSRFRATKEAVVGGLATDLGYERPPMETKKTVQDLAELEAIVAGVNPSLVKALMHAESAGDSFAVSPVGAIGLMQVMPFNAKRCGLKSPGELFDDRKNIKCGVQILREELRTYDNDPVKAIQAYNGGAKCIGRCPESIRHAQIVMKRLATDAT